MEFCTRCGADMTGRKNFCGKCGTPRNVSAMLSATSSQSSALARGLKLCRDCGHTVSMGARACPNCGARRPGLSRKVYGVIGAVAILFGLVIFAALEAPNGSSDSDSAGSLASQPPDLKTTASQLFADYQANEVAADEEYKNRVVQVSGNIDTIGKDLMNTIYVTLSSGEEIEVFNVQLFFSDAYEKQTAMLQKGEFLVTRCRCDGKFGNVMLKDCVIESASENSAAN